MAFVDGAGWMGYEILGRCLEVEINSLCSADDICRVGIDDVLGRMVHSVFRVAEACGRPHCYIWGRVSQ